jgi:tripartite-type tricarboxylate transporter receptor subunit TctC
MGLPDLAIPFWMGLWAPKNTPKDVVAKINAAVMAAHADEITRQRLRDQGVEPPPPEQRTPDAFGAFHKAEVEKWWPFIKSADIKAQ